MPPFMNIDVNYRAWDVGEFDLFYCCDLIYVAKHIWKIHMWQSCHLGKGVCHVMQFFPILNLKKNLNLNMRPVYDLCLKILEEMFCTLHLHVTKG